MITFCEYAEKWLADSKKRHLPNTHNWYVSVVGSLKDKIGNIELDKIDTSNIESKKQLTVLKTVLNSAKKEGISDKILKITIPKSEPLKEQIDNEVILKLLKNENLKYRLIITLVIETHMRKGEVLGLKWTDIDFKQNELSIQRTTFYEKGKGAVIREYEQIWKAYFSENTAKLLKLYAEIYETEFVFQTVNGKIMRSECGVFQFIKKFCKKNKLPHFTLESLRKQNK